MRERKLGGPSTRYLRSRGGADAFRTSFGASRPKVSVVQSRMGYVLAPMFGQVINDVGGFLGEPNGVGANKRRTAIRNINEML